MKNRQPFQSGAEARLSSGSAIATFAITLSFWEAATRPQGNINAKEPIATGLLGGATDEGWTQKRATPFRFVSYK